MLPAHRMPARSPPARPPASYPFPPALPFPPTSCPSVYPWERQQICSLEILEDIFPYRRFILFLALEIKQESYALNKEFPCKMSTFLNLDGLGRTGVFNNVRLIF